MHAGIIAKAIGELVPLATGSHAVDHAVECQTRVDAFSALLVGRVEFVQKMLEEFPQVIGNLPDCQQSGVSCWHSWLPEEGDIYVIGRPLTHFEIDCKRMCSSPLP